MALFTRRVPLQLQVNQKALFRYPLIITPPAAVRQTHDALSIELRETRSVKERVEQVCVNPYPGACLPYSRRVLTLPYSGVC
jgi:hypothetical protein